MSNHTTVKIIISVAALALIVSRWVWPKLDIDAISIGLLIVAALPWLSSILESAKLPGGWEIKFRDLEKAAKLVTGSATTESDVTATNSFLDVAAQDPNLALVGLRIEIERRMRALAEKHGIRDPRSMKHLINELELQVGLTAASLGGLSEIIDAGNRAAHGARVELRVADWAIDNGPRILAMLDEKLTD